MSRCLADQRGSAALTLSWFMLLSVLLALALDSFLGIYVAKRQGQTAADAATLALTRQVSVYLPATVLGKATERVRELLDDKTAQENIRQYAEVLDKAEETCRKLQPLCTPLTPQERADKLVDNRASEYAAAFHRIHPETLPAAMAKQIAVGTWSTAPTGELLDSLIPSEWDLGCLVMATARTHANDLFGAAADLAHANNAELDMSRSSVLLDWGHYAVVVQRTVHPFGADRLFAADQLPTLHIANETVLSHVGSRTPQYPQHC